MIIKKKKKLQVIKRDIPLVSETQLKETREKINKTNRDRSKSHERRVAVLLHGDRVPMSGAHKAYKGDVIIPLRDGRRYIIECKMSSLLHYGIPSISFTLTWLSKLKYEVSSMNAMFGIFVLHYHNNNVLKDYVLIHENDINTLFAAYDINLFNELREIQKQAPILDIRTKQDGSIRKAYKFDKTAVEKDMYIANGLRAKRYLTNDGIYTLLFLQDFRTIVEDI